VDGCSILRRRRTAGRLFLEEQERERREQEEWLEIGEDAISIGKTI